MPFDGKQSESSVTRNLRTAREMLSTCYVKGQRDDYRGGHCALGVLDIVTANDATYTQEAIQLAKFAADIDFDTYHKHPVLKCVPASRIAAHNNTLGKDATLQMFDNAIADSVRQDMEALA